MNENRKILSNSDIYTRIDALPLATSERAAALQSLRNGEAVADAILGAYYGLKNIFQGVVPKPNFKH